MVFFQQFGLLFSNMEWYVLVPFLVGIIFLIIEFLEPGFGIFGISGLACLIVSVVLRAVLHKPEDNVVMQLFQFLLVDALILGLCLLLLFIAQKKGWLKKGIFTVGTAVDPSFSNGTENYTGLLGKEGTALTVLRPAGKAEIDGNTYDVVSADFLIEQGDEIVVSNVEGGTIRVVKKINETK